jgi:hypothetical protein
MATQVQFRRGTTSQTASFIGALGEVTVDTVKLTAVIHDALTLGGLPLLREDGTNSSLSPGSLTSCALKFANSSNTGFISPGQGQIALVTNGTSRLIIDSSGSATFSGNLTVNGSLVVAGTTTSSDTLTLIIALS